MNQTKMKSQPEERQRKSDEAQQFSEDRAQLLDTIREMIDFEFERRRMKTEDNPQPENPPPDCKPPRRTFWQRIVRLFIA